MENKTNVLSICRSPKVEYKVLPYTKIFEGGGSFITYGVEALCQGETVLLMREISVDYEKVKHFVELCNTHNASLEHMEDLVHDFFYYG